jgi:tetratricopeptide (TPR) repeat protein
MMALFGMSLDNLLGWLIVVAAFGFWGWRSLLKSDDRRNLVIKWGWSVILLLITAWIATWRVPFKPLLLVLPLSVLGISWIPNVFDILVKPLTNAFDGGAEEPEMKPFYFRAETHRRKGLYKEAVEDVRRQLEQFPGDVEGMMKMAAIQAEDQRDLAAATATLNELLEQPGLPPARTVAALQTLADWQMNLGRDTAAARRSFERIIQIFPDSPVSLAAEQRIAHLEGVSQAREFREHAVFKVPVRERDLGLRHTIRPEPSPEDESEAIAAECVRQLQKYPNDTETREKLALLYAESLDRLDLAVSQLEQLAALPNAPPKQIAHWLELLATLHIRQGNDIQAAENALRRIIERFPDSALASRAAARLATLQGELKAAATVTAAKALGVYEKDLGLKSSSGKSI